VPETDPDGLVIADDILLALMLLVGTGMKTGRVSDAAKPASIRLYIADRAVPLYSAVGGIMQAGRLRHRVTIQNFTTSRTPSGQPVENGKMGKLSGPR
jgi:hypothetical protein